MKIIDIKNEQGKTFVKFDQDVSNVNVIGNNKYSTIEKIDDEWYKLSDIGGRGIDIDFQTEYTIIGLDYIKEYTEQKL
jgi:hypothetical protein